MLSVNDRPWRWHLWPILIAGYFALQIGMRLAFGPSLELDEAEARFFSTSLALGYGPQPPLYFWLQWLVFKVIGPGIPALALLKAVILTATLWQVWRFLLPFGLVAASVGSLSLGLLPDIVWESQRALTHTTLVVCLTMTAVIVCWRVLNRGTWLDHAVLGLVLGAGQLSKSNFAFVSVALLLTMASRSDWRARLYPDRLGVAVAVAALVAAPVPIFALLHPDLALASLHKLGLSGFEGSALARMAQFVTAFGGALAGLLALPVLALAGPVVLRWRRFRPVAQGVTLDDRLAFLVRFGLIGLGVTLAFGLASGATEVRGRWLVPLIWPLVVVPSVWLALGASRRGVDVARALLAALWVLAAAALPWASLRDPGYRGADFSALAAQLKPGDRIASNTTWVMGNLMQFDEDWTLIRSEDPMSVAEANVVIMTDGVRSNISSWQPLESVDVHYGQRSRPLVMARRVE